MSDEIEWQTHRLPSGTVVRVGVDVERQGVRFAMLDDKHWHGFVVPINDAVEVMEWLKSWIGQWRPPTL